MRSSQPKRTNSMLSRTHSVGSMPSFSSKPTSRRNSGYSGEMDEVGLSCCAAHVFARCPNVCLLCCAQFGAQIVHDGGSTTPTSIKDHTPQSSPDAAAGGMSVAGLAKKSSKLSVLSQASSLVSGSALVESMESSGNSRCSDGTMQSGGEACSTLQCLFCIAHSHVAAGAAGGSPVHPVEGEFRGRFVFSASHKSLLDTPKDQAGSVGAGSPSALLSPSMSKLSLLPNTATGEPYVKTRLKCCALGVIILPILISVTSASAKKGRALPQGWARTRREPARAISPE
jgi:hypothetical protein